MSVGGLTAVLFTREGPKVIDRIVSDLSFRSTDPGGFAGINLTLAVPVTRDDLAYSHLAIFDASTGEQVAAGQMPDSGQSPGFGQPIRELTAVGAGIGAMQNQKKPRIYVDGEQEAWVQAFGTSLQTTSWQYKESPSGGGFHSWVLDITSLTAPVNRRADLRYHPIRSTDQWLGGYTFSHRAGRASANNRMRAYASSYVATTFDITSDQGWSTSTVDVAAQVGSEFALASERDNVFLSYLRQSSTLTVDQDLDWVEVFNLTVQGTRMGRDGQILTAADYVNGPTTPDIFVDVFARVEGIDALSARIDPDPALVVPFRHAQLAWREGVNDYEIANEIVEKDPRYTWAVWGRQPNGLYEAEVRLKPTEPRYELSVEDDFVPADDTGNRSKWLSEVWVVGPIDSGRIVARRVPAGPGFEPPAGAPFASTSVRMSRFSSTSDADRLGTATIEQSYLTANAAKARVSRKVKDNLTGRLVEPYMIRPGYLCRVRGKRPESVDALNPSLTTDSTVFRIASTSYRHSQGAVDLELNAYSLTEASAISSLARAIR